MKQSQTSSSKEVKTTEQKWEKALSYLVIDQDGNDFWLSNKTKEFILVDKGRISTEVLAYDPIIKLLVYEWNSDEHMQGDAEYYHCESFDEAKNMAKNPKLIREVNQLTNAEFLKKVNQLPKEI